ncbi:hypothetical protein PCH_Pc16g04950 [Penicillium rubens Wisconsin 54-1255]|uniref:Uncharacterized protein n=1 Tax=Penicillium rubens (strain ATCC 28089 / DSM 1075 / NRRL 1951 / Wisconsin 54-1255) TaxID=500485 RepID=B6H9A5_PENRW|nr:hypothetical protein PCH_Pc16g04950 [Penicillium rubens Wisconsin 54-1255]
MGRYPETRVSMHDLINKGKPTLEAKKIDLGCEGLGHAAWGCGAVDMFLRRGNCLSPPCFEVIRGLIDMFKSCRHIYSHVMIYSVSCSSRNAYKWMCGYHFLFSSRKALAQSLIQPTHYTTTDMYYKASPAPLKDYRRGCSDCTTGLGEYVIVTGVWPACTTSIVHTCRGQSHSEGTTYQFVPLSRRDRFNCMRVHGLVSLSHADIEMVFWSDYYCMKSPRPRVCMDVFMMGTIQGVKAVANMGIT